MPSLDFTAVPWTAISCHSARLLGTSAHALPPGRPVVVRLRPHPAGVPDLLKGRARWRCPSPSSRMGGRTQPLEHVDSGLPLLFREGYQAPPRATSLCQRILDGELPPVMPDFTVHPGA